MKNFNKHFFGISLFFASFFLISITSNAQTNPCDACQFLPPGTVIVIPGDGGIYQCTSMNPASCITLVAFPIELVSFDGALTEDNVSIKWSTASETDNAGFDIERSFDGKNFEAIEFIEGSGHSTEMLYYTFTDRNVKNTALSNTAYYRLKQLDFDGTVSYTNMIVIDLKKEAQEFQFNTIRGTNSKQLEVYYEIDNINSNVKILVSDITGRTLLNTSANPTEGFNVLNLDLSNYLSGIYIISLVNDEKVISQKISLQ